MSNGSSIESLFCDVIKKRAMYQLLYFKIAYDSQPNSNFYGKRIEKGVIKIQIKLTGG